MSFRRSQIVERQFENTFMQELEDSLIKKGQNIAGIDEFQAVYNKKKMVGRALEFEKKLKRQTKENLEKVKQRVCQIEELNNRVSKQASLLKNQYEKVSEAHALSKILLMEKIVKLQRETDELSQKKQQYYKRKADKERANISNKSYLIRKIGRYRMNDDSLAYELMEKKSQTLQLKKSKADEMRASRERRRLKSQKIEEFKQERARSNYINKVNIIKRDLDEKNNKLKNLFEEEVTQEKHAEVTETVTKEYLNSFFATETI